LRNCTHGRTQPFGNPHRRKPRTGPPGTVGMMVRNLDRVTAYYRDMSVAATLDDDCEQGRPGYFRALASYRATALGEVGS
jgi:hypothetical protein